MKFERYTPADLLKPFVKTFMIIESEQGMESKVLPDTSIVLAFRYKGLVSYNEAGIENRLPAAVISGLRKSTRLLNYAPDTATFLVILHEGGAAAFLDEPLHQLFDMSLSLDRLIQGSLLEIEERLAAARDNRHRVAIIEQFLMAHLAGSQPDRLILRAVHDIKCAHGTIRIKNLAASLSLSQDTFEKRFRRVVGTSPKQFSEIVRLRDVIGSCRRQADSLTEVALTAGYFDQAHFIKEFKSFTGQTPKDFFKSSSFW